MTTNKHQSAKPGSKARMIARRDKRIRSQAAELIRLRADHARLVDMLRLCADAIEDENAPKSDLPQWQRERVDEARAALAKART